MKHDIDHDSTACTAFLDQLDQWLARELDANQSLVMAAHHAICSACQQETRLAGAITSITQTLPAQVCPPLHLSGLKHAGNRHGFVARLLTAWRQPLVFVPAFVLVLAAMLVIQLRDTHTQTEPDVVLINGQEYTREQIMQAAQDLELALRYLDKYGSYPARVVHAELEQSHLPLPPPQANIDAPAI